MIAATRAAEFRLAGGRPSRQSEPEAQPRIGDGCCPSAAARGLSHSDRSAAGVWSSSDVSTTLPYRTGVCNRAFSYCRRRWLKSSLWLPKVHSLGSRRIEALELGRRHVSVTLPTFTRATRRALGHYPCFARASRARCFDTGASSNPLIDSEPVTSRFSELPCRLRHIMNEPKQAGAEVF